MASKRRWVNREPNSRGGSANAWARLAQSPILVFDEPTSGLDEQTGQRLVYDVLAATGGASILYVTHRSDELAFFDEVIVIDKRKVVGHMRAPSTPDSCS
jgi:ABC-type transport system involved in cytochrome bd biosynthesis fused ATPase/permease subunit